MRFGLSRLAGSRGFASDSCHPSDLLGTSPRCFSSVWGGGLLSLRERCLSSRVDGVMLIERGAGSGRVVVGDARGDVVLLWSESSRLRTGMSVGREDLKLGVRETKLAT